MFLHAWVSVELLTPDGDGRGAQRFAPPLKFIGSCISKSEEMSVVVISPVGLPPGIYKDALLAGTSLVCLLADPGPGFSFPL